MRIQERLDDAVQALHRGSHGRLSVPVPHGVRIVAFRTVPEEDVSRIIADLENTAALLDEAERVVEEARPYVEANASAASRMRAHQIGAEVLCRLDAFLAKLRKEKDDVATD